MATDGISLGETKAIAFDSASFGEVSLSVASRHIVVLIGPNTSSSGEAIPVAFAGQQDTATLGKPTSGYSTANRAFELRTLHTSVCDSDDFSHDPHHDKDPPQYAEARECDNERPSDD